MIRNDYRLADRYQAETGKVFLSGIQALARIPIQQLRMDRAANLNTAAFVSGYPGSPLGGFDVELARALKVAGDLPITHLPAVNEELGASAVMGSQLAATRPDARYDGVVGIWYGKAPGLDRATDALRHGVFAGSSATGGALALVGDDPAAKSSTMPSSSDAALVDLHVPILYPATVAECLELGLHGIAMSRATGLWSSLKVVTPVADGTGTVAFPVLTQAPSIPTITINGEVWQPAPSAQFLGPRMVAVEQEFHEVRSGLALRYGIDNKLNRTTANPPDAWIGIVATGYTYAQVVEALRRLGFPDLDAVANAGIRLLHLRMPVPFDPAQVIRFAAGLEEILVVEEKNPTLERLIRDCLYSTSLRPAVVGKQTEDGSKLLASYGLLDADAITPALRSRLRRKLEDRLAPPPPEPRELIPLAAARTPFFCSGCPHNWGTKVPEGAVVGMGTGCHGMTLLMDEDRVGQSIGITAMGNEGAQWLGMAPFVNTNHVFQNFGDGTYFHSGQLAVQAAIGAGANITFKILYNHTVAMTGGQEASHRIGPGQLAEVLLTHGVKEVAITTDTVGNYKRVRLPKGVKVFDRTKIVEVQERLAALPGVTVLIHDQECSAELRRGRKRGTIQTPTTRVIINHRICEGCGDCGDVSNCLSVQPVTTPLGRKTQIDQASCNFDYSCLQGDCPAFMTVELDPAGQATPQTESVGSDELPDPTLIAVPEPPQTEREATVIRMAGIGGTGVVTTAQILGTAAMLGGLEVDGVDQTGLSQKAGPVISDLTLTAKGAPRRSNLVGSGQAHVIIAFDQLVAASDSAIVAGATEHTAVYASSAVTPTGAQISQPEMKVSSPVDLLARLSERANPNAVTVVDALWLATALTGTSSTANSLLLGVVVQAGDLPVPVAAIREAIRLNGVAVGANLAALEWGRRWLGSAAEVEAVAAGQGETGLRVDTDALPGDLADRVDALGFSSADVATAKLLAADLVSYQDSAYANRFLDLVQQSGQAGGPEFAEAVARGAHKLMAYKDEYEVARLMLAADGLAPARQLVGAEREKPGVTWHLHPPMLRALGINRKLKFSNKSTPLFAALARGKRLRGTRLDPFGRATLRRLERALVDEYFQAIEQVCELLAGPNNSAKVQEDLRSAAVAIAELPHEVRGFEDLKLRRAAVYQDRLAQAVAACSNIGSATASRPPAIQLGRSKLVADGDHAER